ncbi:MAG: DUF6291 domain-containing protein [Eubacteriales bacterium]|nr:DUF6291 domain-containing protein [Eubacteriales bacterium]
MSESMVFYQSFYKSIKSLPRSRQLELFEAIMDYAFEGEINNVSKTVESPLFSIIPQIDANIRKRAKASIAGQASAQKRSLERGHNPTVVEKSINNSATKVQPNANNNENANANANADVDVNVSVSETPSKETTATTNSYAVKYYIRTINQSPSDKIIEAIDDFTKRGMSPQCVTSIMDYCRDNKKTNWSYIKATLENCFDKGIRTPEEYINHEIKRRKKSQSGQGNKKNKNFEEREYSPTEFDDLYFEEMLLV